MSYGANKYKQTSVSTASPGQILIMLYEAAIRNVKKATEAIEKKDSEAKGIAITKTHDIINELANTLNHEVAGDIARDLEGLYNFIIEQLLKANLDNDVAALKSVQDILENLLDGWRGAVEKVQKGIE